MRGMLGMLGLEDFLVPCEHGLDPDEIVARVVAAVQRSAEIRERIAANVPRLRREARDMMSAVLSGGGSVYEAEARA